MSALKKLLQQIETTNKEWRLFDPKDSLVVAVSGGPDSTALLMLLCLLKRKYSFRIAVAHVNHGLLKKEGDRHLSKVKKICEKLKLPFYAKTIELKELAKMNKRSLEEMGRMERYAFFEAIAKKTRSRKIVTAHTLDDQAETVLMRLLRGSGLKGLAGIPTKRKQGSIQVIRPLLGCHKKDLIVYLKEQRIPFCEDKTNKNIRFSRNRVRHQLLPLIAKFFNPQIKESLASFQSVCQETQDYMDQVSALTLRRVVRNSNASKNVSLKLSELKKLHPAVLREVLLKALLKKRGDLKRFGYQHVSGIVGILNSDKTGLEQHLPGPLLVRKSKKSLDFIS